MCYPSDALGNLLHLYLNDLILEVDSLMVDLLLQNSYRLWLSISDYSLLHLVDIEIYLLLCFVIDTLKI